MVCQSCMLTFPGSGLPPYEAPVMIAEKRKLFFSFLTLPAFLAASRSCGTALTSDSGWGCICPSSTSWSYVVLMMPSKPSKDSGTIAPAAFNAAFLSCRDSKHHVCFTASQHAEAGVFAMILLLVDILCTPPPKEAQRHIQGGGGGGANTI